MSDFPIVSSSLDYMGGVASASFLLLWLLACLGQVFVLFLSQDPCVFPSLAKNYWIQQFFPLPPK